MPKQKERQAELELTEQQAALEQIRQVYEDGEAELPSGNVYKLTKMNHARRRKVFAFVSKVQRDMIAGNFWWLESAEFAEVEKIINNCVTVDGSLLSKLPEHWEEHPGDYLLFVQTMLGAISYPFMKGVSGG